MSLSFGKNKKKDAKAAAIEEFLNSIEGAAYASAVEKHLEHGSIPNSKDDLDTALAACFSRGRILKDAINKIDAFIVVFLNNGISDDELVAIASFPLDEECDKYNVSADAVRQAVLVSHIDIFDLISNFFPDLNPMLMGAFKGML